MRLKQAFAVVFCFAMHAHLNAQTTVKAVPEVLLGLKVAAFRSICQSKLKAGCNLSFCNAGLSPAGQAIFNSQSELLDVIAKFRKESDAISAKLSSTDELAASRMKDLMSSLQAKEAQLEKIRTELSKSDILTIINDQSYVKLIELTGNTASIAASYRQKLIEIEESQKLIKITNEQLAEIEADIKREVEILSLGLNYFSSIRTNMSPEIGQKLSTDYSSEDPLKSAVNRRRYQSAITTAHRLMVAEVLANVTFSYRTISTSVKGNYRRDYVDTKITVTKDKIILAETTGEITSSGRTFPSKEPAKISQISGSAETELFGVLKPYRTGLTNGTIAAETAQVVLNAKPSL